MLLEEMVFPQRESPAVAQPIAQLAEQPARVSTALPTTRPLHSQNAREEERGVGIAVIRQRSIGPRLLGNLSHVELPA